IWQLRRPLGDNSEETRLIVTIARKGYQFIENVTVAEAVNTVKQAADRHSCGQRIDQMGVKCSSVGKSMIPPRGLSGQYLLSLVDLRACTVPSDRSVVAAEGTSGS